MGVGGLRAAAVVGDQQLQLVGAVADRDDQPRRAGMADGVGDRLLQDAVGGLVGGGGQLGRRGGQLDLHVQAGLAGHRGQLLQPPQPGRGGGPVLVGVAQHPQGRPQLVRGPGAGLLDRDQGLAGLPGSPVEHVGRDPGLHVDDGDGMGHGVVDLAGDPQPLGVDPPPRLLLPGPLGPPGPLHGLGGQHPPGPDRLAEGGRHDHAPDAEEHPPGPEQRRQVGQQQPAGGQHRGAGRDQADRPVPVALGGHGVGGHEQPHPARPVRVAGGVVGEAGRRRDGEGRYRPAAPDGQDQAAGGQQPIAQPGGIGQRAGQVPG
jgi:hypothetical protein